MTEKTLLEHLETLGAFIDDMDHVELVDDSTVDVGPACDAYKALKTFFDGYYAAKTDDRITRADLQMMTSNFDGRG